MSFGTSFSAGAARIGSLVGLNLTIYAPFYLFGIIFAVLGLSVFASLVRGKEA